MKMKVYPDKVKTPPAKFIQLMSTPSPKANSTSTWLLALDADGQVWIYLGVATGWKLMTDHRMSKAESDADDATFLRKVRSRRTENIDRDDPSIDYYETPF